MACSDVFIESLCNMLSAIGVARARKMMGDWIVYVDEKPIITACDNIAYIKMLPAIEPLMQDAETGYPYEGAKLHYILDTDHSEDALQVLRTLLPIVPYPKKRKTKKKETK